MQTVMQALQNVTNALILLASPVLVLALIIAGFNMASADGSRHEKAKRQLIGIAIAAIVIFGARFIVSTLISFVPGSASF
ncbi:TrbC/VirB2 family protein [candidate division KSB1 bacterium]|nr:TrbC/VirB2 family protein [candidate division KSB1 bacterium]